MELSSNYKYPNLASIEASLGFNEQLPHLHCDCLHCLNNTKPLLRPKAPRMVSKKEKKLVDSLAYRLILKNLAEFGFNGSAKTPDVFLTDTSSLVYSSKAGRMRVKDSQGNMQVKRHFDENRRKGHASLNQVGFINGIMGTSVVESLKPSMAPVKAPKQIAIMAYRDNTQQIVTESMLSKILQKRKNDPFWQEISHILQIPAEMKHPIQKYKYHYERTQQTLQKLLPMLQRMGRQIDNQQQKILTTGTSNLEKSTSGKQDEEDDLQFNPQLKLSKLSSQKLNRISSMQVSQKLKKNLSMAQSTMNFIAAFDQRLKQLQMASLQMVAFLEVTSRYRILNVIFEYFLDEKGRLFVCSAKDVIIEQLQPSQLSFVHDRYQPLQEIGAQQLITAKQTFDAVQQQQLWKICTAVVNECLQIRKIQLKLTHYVKPSNQTLLKIFLKIFPDFKSQEIFSSINWKNELTNIISDIRKKINKIIREDEGIRILRRFDIHFRRTFN